MAQAKKKKKDKKNIEQGKIHIQASFNNTIVTVTDNPVSYTHLTLPTNC